MSIRRVSKSSIAAVGRGSKGATLLRDYFASQDEMELIERAAIGSGGVASLTFSNIPQTYKHLHIRFSIRSSEAFPVTIFPVYFNGDTTDANYWRHVIVGNGVSVVSSQFNTAMNYHYVSGSTAVANSFGGGTIDILEYSVTNKKKAIISVNGVNNANVGANDGEKGYQGIGSGTWNSSAAVTSILINRSMEQHSVVSLFGVRG